MQITALIHTSVVREHLRSYFESKNFNIQITTIILINSILIGLETSRPIMKTYGVFIDLFDLVILILFSIEIVLKIFVYRFSFFRNGWNLFDFGIVAISLIPAAGSFSVFRALRIIRTLRLLKSIPKLRLIIESLLKSIPSIGWISVLLGIVYYTFAVIGVNLYGDVYPDFFGDMGKALFTLFQVMTLESWSSGIARPIMQEAPLSGVYFITFILIATYTTLNIFIAIVVNTMNEISLKHLQEEEEHIKDFVFRENEKLHAKLDSLMRELKKNELGQHL